MEALIACVLPIVALVALVSALIKVSSPVWQAIAVYVCFSIVFGCVHFLYYRSDPKAYIVSKDVPIPAAIQAASDSTAPLTSKLNDVAMTDVILLQLAEKPNAIKWPVIFDTSDRHYGSSNGGPFFDTSMHMRLVGPRHEPIPEYSAVIKMTLAEDYRGIKKGTVHHFYFGDPGEPRLELQAADFINHLLNIRQQSISQLLELYQNGSMSPVLFSLMDFFYFSFSIVGVGEIIPSTTQVRLLVWLQVLCTLIIPVAMGRNRE